eukprot:5316792-Prymnesium_polylepis.2
MIKGPRPRGTRLCTVYPEATPTDCWCGLWPKPPRETGLAPLRRPGHRGCALWTRGGFGDPRGVAACAPERSVIPRSDV